MFFYFAYWRSIYLENGNDAHPLSVNSMCLCGESFFILRWNKVRNALFWANEYRQNNFFACVSKWSRNPKSAKSFDVIWKRRSHIWYHYVRLYNFLCWYEFFVLIQVFNWQHCYMKFLLGKKQMILSCYATLSTWFPLWRASSLGEKVYIMSRLISFWLC